MKINQREEVNSGYHIIEKFQTAPLARAVPISRSRLLSQVSRLEAAFPPPQARLRIFQAASPPLFFRCAYKIRLPQKRFSRIPPLPLKLRPASPLQPLQLAFCHAASALRSLSPLPWSPQACILRAISPPALPPRILQARLRGICSRAARVFLQAAQARTALPAFLFPSPPLPMHHNCQAAHTLCWTQTPLPRKQPHPHPPLPQGAR